MPRRPRRARSRPTARRRRALPRRSGRRSAAMSSPLSFLRPLRYDRIRRVLLVQTGSGTQLPGIVVKLREIFPGSSIHALVREADGELQGTLEVERFEVARWEDRFELLARLRRQRFDTVVLQLTGSRSELRFLPFLV